MSEDKARIATLAQRYRYNIDAHQPVCYPPSITYQYSLEGEIDNSHGGPTMIWSPTVPEEFRAKFFAQWGFKAEKAWGRLRELIAEKLARLPDNPFVMRDAWMVGIGDGGPDVASYRKTYDLWVVALAAAERKDLAKTARRLELESFLTVKVMSRQPDSATVRVTSIESADSLKFVCRNIFDFGYVVNPAYPIIPGAKPGGLANGGHWMEFIPGHGWENVRPLTQLEQMAMEYLTTYPPIESNTRM